MQERNVVARESGRSVATVSFLAIVIIAAIIALFVWQPWNTAQHIGAVNSGTASTTK